MDTSCFAVHTAFRFATCSKAHFTYAVFSPLFPIISLCACAIQMAGLWLRTYRSNTWPVRVRFAFPPLLLLSPVSTISPCPYSHVHPSSTIGYVISWQRHWITQVVVTFCSWQCAVEWNLILWLCFDAESQAIAGTTNTTLVCVQFFITWPTSQLTPWMWKSASFSASQETPHILSNSDFFSVLTRVHRLPQSTFVSLQLIPSQPISLWCT